MIAGCIETVTLHLATATRGVAALRLRLSIQDYVFFHSGPEYIAILPDQEDCASLILEYVPIPFIVPLYVAK